MSQLITLDEFVYKELKKEIDPKTLKRSKTLGASRYVGLEHDGKTARFKTKAQTTPNKNYWTQWVRMEDFDEVKGMDDLTVFEKVTLLISGDLSLKCNCPAFTYWGFEYILTQLDAVFGGEEDRYPEVRNPDLEGIVCKHLARVLYIFPFNIPKITRDMKAGGYLEGRKE